MTMPPTIRDSKNIGKGLEFLNRYLSSKLFQEPQRGYMNYLNSSACTATMASNY